MSQTPARVPLPRQSGDPNPLRLAVRTTRDPAPPKNRHIPLAVSYRRHSHRGRLRCLAGHSFRPGRRLNPKYQNSAHNRARCYTATHQALGHRAPWTAHDRLPKKTFIQTVPQRFRPRRLAAQRSALCQDRTSPPCFARSAISGRYGNDCLEQVVRLARYLPDPRRSLPW